MCVCVCVFVPACICVCFFASGCFSLCMCVCVFKTEKREKPSARVEDSQAVMDGSTLSRAKCNLTAEFNDIRFEARHFQTCSGFILSAGPQFSTMPQAWCEFTHNVREWRMFRACLMSVCMR